MFGREPAGAMPGVILADYRAFLDLGAGLGDGFADLGRDESGEVVALGAQGAGERAQVTRAKNGRSLAPAEEGVMGLLHRGREVHGGMQAVNMQALAGGGIEGKQRHGRSMSVDRAGAK
jgi:hypothetical protein